MRLVTFDAGHGPSIGLLDPDGVIRDLGAVVDVPADMVGVVARWAELAGSIAAAAATAPAVPDAALRAPIVPPSNVICVGKNYEEHVREFSASGYDTSRTTEFPPHPVVFTKSRTSIADPGAPIPVSLDDTGTTDYEGELAVVIGRGGFRIPADEATAHVFGYTIVNDLTVRALQQRHQQFFLGKSFRGYCPIGPCIVTADEIPDVTALRVRTTVNGEVRQDAPVADLHFDVPALIESISWSVELHPGDVIATGTPGGVAVGFSPPKYLRPGDRVEVEIEPIGVLGNTAE